MPKQGFAPLSSSGIAPVHLGTILLLVIYYLDPIVSYHRRIESCRILASVTVCKSFGRGVSLDQHAWISGNHFEPLGSLPVFRCTVYSSLIHRQCYALSNARRMCRYVSIHIFPQVVSDRRWYIQISRPLFVPILNLSVTVFRLSPTGLRFYAQILYFHLEIESHEFIVWVFVNARRKSPTAETNKNSRHSVFTGDFHTYLFLLLL
jgi:hypothetical protein